MFCYYGICFLVLSVVYFMCMICVSELGCEEYGSDVNRLIRLRFVVNENFFLYIK